MSDDFTELYAENQQLTMVAGVVIEGDFVYVAQSFDAFEEFADEMTYSRISAVDLSQSGPRRWLAHDLPWTVTSVCVWDTYTDARRLYVTLSAEGDVELAGPSGSRATIWRVGT